MPAQTQHSQENTAEREIVISRELHAPRELVFSAWTKIEHLQQWWGPLGFSTTTHAFDFRPGGTWRFIMHGPDGVDYPNWITYREIVPPERIVYAHGGGTDVKANFVATVTFEATATGTRLTMRSLFPTAAERNAVVEKYHAIEGGNQTLDRLAEYLAKMD